LFKKNVSKETRENVTEKPNWTAISNGQPALNPAFLL
jgi:hypothetical protein